MKARGWSYGRIAEKLNRDGVPCAQGGKAWYAATIRAALSSPTAKEMDMRYPRYCR
jgi:hypothetical protein